MKGQQPAIDDIASQILKLETLDTRNSDELDFHELAVWQIKEALQAAYNTGEKAGYDNGCEYMSWEREQERTNK